MRSARVVVALLMGSLLVGGVLLAGCATSSSLVTALGTSTTASAVSVSVQPPAGWKKYTGGGAEIYLPPSFDLNLLDANTLTSIQAEGPQQAEAVQAYQALDTSQFAIAVGDFASAASGSPTVVGVALSKTDVEVTLKEYVDYHLAAQMSDYQISGRTDLYLNGREATQFVAKQAPSSQLMCAVKGPSGFWIIAYITTTAEFQTRLPDFEKSAATFTILP